MVTPGTALKGARLCIVRGCVLCEGVARGICGRVQSRKLSLCSALTLLSKCKLKPSVQFNLLVILDAMQFYPAPAVPPQVRPEYAYPATPIATSPRMNWSPTMHQGPWGSYEFAYPGYPDSHRIHASLVGEHPNATPHNIRDILGAHPGAVPSEMAKMPGVYQRSPIATTAGEHFVRSPTTPTSAHMHPIPGKPFEGVVYSEVPGCFYGVPAIPRLQG